MLITIMCKSCVRKSPLAHTRGCFDTEARDYRIHNSKNTDQVVEEILCRKN